MSGRERDHRLGQRVVDVDVADARVVAAPPNRRARGSARSKRAIRGRVGIGA